jgi:hypothetical protein
MVSLSRALQGGNTGIELAQLAVLLKILYRLARNPPVFYLKRKGSSVIDSVTEGPKQPPAAASPSKAHKVVNEPGTRTEGW